MEPRRSRTRTRHGQRETSCASIAITVFRFARDAPVAGVAEPGGRPRRGRLHCRTGKPGHRDYGNRSKLRAAPRRRDRRRCPPGLSRGRSSLASSAYPVPNLVTSIVVSACLGALVGLIRQWSDQKASPNEEADFGGVRTYTFWAILGCVGAFLSDSYAAAVLPVLLALVGLHLTALHLKATGSSHPGSTTFAASLLTCLLGALVLWGHTQAAILIAAATAVMIGLKQPIHAWTRTFTVDDIRATLQFVAITGVVLPLVPEPELRSVRRVQSLRDLAHGRAHLRPGLRRIHHDAPARREGRHRDHGPRRRSRLQHGHHARLQPAQPRRAGDVRQLRARRGHRLHRDAGAHPGGGRRDQRRAGRVAARAARAHGHARRRIHRSGRGSSTARPARPWRRRAFTIP